MANIKIAQLTSQLTLSDTDTVIVETATSTNKMSVSALKIALGIQMGGTAESGSNEFGSYVKYADGRLEMWGETAFTSDVNGWVVGWLYFPIHTEFPLFPVATIRDGGAQNWAGNIFLGASDPTRINVIMTGGTGSQPYKVSWQIKTRWKA